MSNDDALISPEKVEEIRHRLLRHFDLERRDLPWRGETDPYRIWVSEVMLQQTRVESVIPYYRKWVEQFPTLESLAEAEEEEVLRLWRGLGYYSRARRLMGAARLVRERFGGGLPRRAEELKALPGVGEYTAGAVASIAFGEAVPAVDGNARRVLSRVFDLADPGPARLQALASELVDPERPGAFNQALMETGSTVCTARSPDCHICPLNDLCLARQRGTVDERPARKKRRTVPRIDVAVLVAAWAPDGSGDGTRESGDGGPNAGDEAPHAGDEAEAFRLLIRKRPDEGLLAGMWEFPGREIRPAGNGGSAPEVIAAVRRLAGDLGLETGSGIEPLPLPPVPHVFSHLRARYHPFLLLARERCPVESGKWVRLAELADVALPVAQQKIAQATREALERGV